MSTHSLDEASPPAASLTPEVTSQKGHAQRTLRRPIFCKDVGLHTGRHIRMTLLPAAAGTGIQFQRTDIPNTPPFRVNYDAVTHTRLATVIAPSSESAHTITTIEHLMAALYGMEIDNVLVQLSGPELPVLDGSASAFSFLLSCAGFEEQNTVRHLIDVQRSVEVTGPNGEKACLHPHTNRKNQTLDLSLSIDFPAPAIGRQAYHASLSRSRFLKELAFCRTFVNYDEVATLQKQGMALGGSLHNAIVVDHDVIMNPAGLHHPDEFVRHKVLDALGDLYCSGYRICGCFEGVKTGHALNNRLLHALFSSHDHWRFIPDRRRLSSFS